MTKRIIGSLILSALLCASLYAHSGKPRFHVIVDTDGAIDDMRAITMLLSGNDIRVLGITCSQGTLLPETVFVKVSSLLAAFHHEGIPVGTGEKISFAPPAWSAFARELQWADETRVRDTEPPGKSDEILGSILETYRDKVTLVALGSLKTYADFFKANGEAKDKIDRIIWYNDHNIREGFNYRVSPESYEYIRQSGIRLEVVGNPGDHLLTGNDYLDQIRNAGSIYARQIAAVHSGASVTQRINDRHLHLWDDLVPLYLTVSVLFEAETEQNISMVSVSRGITPGMIYGITAELLASANRTNNRVFMEFPMDTALYKPDYAMILDETIGKFGPIEWKAICMTNEIHGHTGIYSIIGAKMGIRAMEYFNVGINNLEVVSFAGNIPPVSCFNDGIQVSTGSTIGQGLITVSDGTPVIPAAIFRFHNREVRMALKPEIARQMEDEIGYAVRNYGPLTEKYWLYIEKLAIRYWTGLDRHEIFVLEKM